MYKKQKWSETQAVSPSLLLLPHFTTYVGMEGMYCAISYILYSTWAVEAWAQLIWGVTLGREAWSIAILVKK